MLEEIMANNFQTWWKKCLYRLKKFSKTQSMCKENHAQTHQSQIAGTKDNEEILKTAWKNGRGIMI